MLRGEGRVVNHKKVERIWRNEGLKVPKKRPKRGRLWLNDGFCIRLRPEHGDHVWSYDSCQLGPLTAGFFGCSISSTNIAGNARLHW